MRPALIALALLCAACRRETPKPPAGGAAAVRDAGARDLATNAVVSLEIGGRVSVLPGDGGAGAGGRVLIALADGPCFRPGTHWLALGRPGADGAYALQAFTAPGTRVEVCAAALDGDRRRTFRWARAERGPFPIDRGSRLAGVDVTIGVAPVEIQIPDAIPLP